ncbi:MAG TPA: hypothetical protein PL041_00955 [Melioribacteraceae bacterium]|nr:hypothetical protein [Melioribacteraceae bacterium]
MKKYKFLLLALFSICLLSACDLIDPTEVDNPAITEEKLLQDATGGAEPLITGLKFDFANALMQTIKYTELVSDNYDNTSTFLSNIADNPWAILPSETDLDDTREIYFRLQTLHAKALFGLEVILPKDSKATHEDYATVYFYKGMAILLLSENFSAFPLQENGGMIKAKDALQIGVDHFKKSIELNGSTENTTKCAYALARAYRQLGDKVNAERYANEALSLDGQYLLLTEYDDVNLDNIINTFTVTRNLHDLQPLPRLDYLDPKYTTQITSIPALKSEEAYLILAEIAIVNNNLSTAKANLIDAINLALSRPKENFKDRDPRNDRPNDNDCIVKADANSIGINGLIKKRNNSFVEIATISNTSVTADQVNSAITSTDLYKLLYLIRQEIFFSEGRRMSDLGIRLPVMQTQIDANPSINPGEYGTSVYVPAFIPTGYGLDEFTYDSATKVVTITYDMNKLISQNINLVSPFLMH